jgi:DNA mismatch repair protein MutS
MQARQMPRSAARTTSGRARDDRPLDERSARRENRSPASDAVISADAKAEADRFGHLSSEPDLAAPFRSILVPPGAALLDTETAAEPEFFSDLNLDKIVAAVTAGKDDYQLAPFFYRPVRDLATIDYRHAVMRDLEQDDVLQIVRSFAQGMRNTRQHLALSAKLHYARQKKLWFLDAVATYCAAIAALAQAARAATLRSQGFAAFRDYLIDYANSAAFTTLVAETEKLQVDLSTVKYSILIRGDKITVERYEDTPDYSSVVEHTFDRFQQGAVRNYLVKFTDSVDMNHVEAGVLGFVADLYPEIFSYLDDYVERHREFIEPTIGRFDREIQFYVSYLEHIALLKNQGLRFCYPRLSASSKKVASRDGFDSGVQ